MAMATMINNLSVQQEAFVKQMELLLHKLFDARQEALLVDINKVPSNPTNQQPVGVCDLRKFQELEEMIVGFVDNNPLDRPANLTRLASMSIQCQSMKVLNKILDQSSQISIFDAQKILRAWTSTMPSTQNASPAWLAGFFKSGQAFLDHPNMIHLRSEHPAKHRLPTA